VLNGVVSLEKLKMNRLIVDNTYRSLLIYMLYDPSWKLRDYILIRGRISDDFIVRFKEQVNNALIRNNFPYISLKHPIASAWSRICFLKNLKKYEAVYGNVYELKLRKFNQKLVQVDDGLMTKNILNGEHNKVIKHLGLRNFFLFRCLLNVDYNVDLKSFRFIVPESYRSESFENKCEYISVVEMINDLCESRYLEICEVFGFTPSETNGKSIFMLQSFFDDGLVSSIDYEIGMYKRILESEGLKECEVYIKPHPRSTIDYRKFFKNSEFIPKDFPYEILVRKSNNIRFEKVISVHSSGLEEFIPIADEVVCFGTSEFQELDHTPMIRWK